MNIGINARLFIKDKLEGVATYIYENTKRMVLDHPEDQFFFFFDRKYDDSFIFANNITPIIVYPSARHPILWEIWWQWQIPRYLKKHQIDVFYTGEIFMPRKTKVPKAIVSHDLAYLHYPDQIPSAVRKYYARTYPINHQQADAIISVSEFTKSDIVKQYGIDPKKIDVIYNDVPGGFKPLSETEKANIRNQYTNGKKYFAYLGSFHPRKNIVNLIKAYNTFKSQTESDYKLLLMGRWSWFTEPIKKALSESPYKSDIIVREEVGNEKYHLVAASEALCYISLFEGFGIPILEGFSAGVPVITSKVSSMPEVSNGAALEVDPKNAIDIACALSTIISDQSLRSTHIAKGFKRLKDFSWQRSSEQTYKIISKLKNKNQAN